MSLFPTEHLPMLANMATQALARFDNADGKEKYSSCTGRVNCLISGPLAGVVAFKIIRHVVAEDVHSSRAWKILDIVLFTIFTPLLVIVATIRGLFGAIFHPGVIFKKAPNESDNSAEMHDDSAPPPSAPSALLNSHHSAYPPLSPTTAV